MLKWSHIGWITIVVLLSFQVAIPQSYGQEEVASAIRRYRDRDVSTGYYEQYEMLPTRQRPLVGVPGVSQGVFPYSPSAAQIRIRSRLADSHRGVRFYEALRCTFCHPEQARDIHTTRANLTCRQCHGVEPIASIQHFYSPLNPIRRHAYVCAKCHEGASASFGSYVIHQPPAGSLEAKERFPLLYYAYWFMVVLLVGTLGFFIPHSFLAGLREWIARRKETGNGGNETN